MAEMRTAFSGMLWLSQIFKPKRIAEIGIYHGKTLIAMMKHYHDLNYFIQEYYAIDPYTRESFQHAVKKSKVSIEHAEQAYKLVSETIDQYPEYYSRVILTRDYGYNVAPLFEDKYFDFVYIDCNHTYEGTLKELLAWKDKTKMMAGHDYAVNEPTWGVRKAVHEVYGNRITILPTCTWMVRDE